MQFPSALGPGKKVRQPAVGFGDVAQKAVLPGISHPGGSRADEAHRRAAAEEELSRKSPPEVVKAPDPSHDGTPSSRNDSIQTR